MRPDLAARVFGRLSAAGLAEQATLRRKDTFTDIPVTAVFRESVERGEEGIYYQQQEISVSAEDGPLNRGDRITLSGVTWICIDPSKQTGYVSAAFVAREK